MDRILSGKAAAAFMCATTLALILASWPISASADNPLRVLVVRAAEVATSRHLALTGEIVAPESLNAAFPTGGRIAEIAVDDGDRVTSGQILARIDQVQQEQALRGAQAQLTAATADFNAAREDDERQTALLERGATTRAARNAAANRFAAAVAGRAQAQAELEQATEALDDTVLRATAEGTVIRRLAEPGQVVGAAQPILQLTLGDGYDAVFDVPEAGLGGTDTLTIPVITLSPLDRPEITVTGHVREISPLVEASKGTVEVTVAMDAPLPGLTYGDAVRGRADRVEESAILLPWSAVTAVGNEPAVWIVDPATNKVALRAVVVRRYTSNSILIESGVEPGETVVQLGAQLLYPGRVVVATEVTK